ncbi:helix-turn-helix transcriptional regulator [Sulfitobacter mediterraneus]|uniref:helix-turn-helix transcriptional regulator n=1 Tax=Sulfitobacter mediterraneus TaxID=83219 RepID=UPI000EA04837|nr:AlpA family transcriptional regulator [Sulfitobacter mediterraneus]UWR11552.1 AlpA family transcriptional regulator [Sulfitobacter mediterraneus]
MKQIADERLLTRKEVEEAFGLSKRFLELAAVNGRGPIMIKIGRSVRYRASDIRIWIDDHAVKSTSQLPGLAR